MEESNHEMEMDHELSDDEKESREANNDNKSEQQQKESSKQSVALRSASLPAMHIGEQYEMMIADHCQQSKSIELSQIPNLGPFSPGGYIQDEEEADGEQNEANEDNNQLELQFVSGNAVESLWHYHIQQSSGEMYQTYKDLFKQTYQTTKYRKSLVRLY